MENKDVYFVAMKAFLVDDDGRLLIMKDRFGDWDILGGRLKEHEFETPLEAVLERKIREEVGEKVKYEIGKPVVFMRHERNEILADGTREKRRIFAVGYEVKYMGGEIVMGKNHEKYEWVDIKTFQPETYFTGGWLKGVKDFQEYYKNN